MRRLARALVAVAAVLAIAATVASPASATANHEITLTGYTPLEVGRGAVFRVDGTVAPPAEYWDSSWILAVAIPVSVTPECPADASSAGTVAGQAGTILAIALRPATDETGRFSNVIAYTPQSPGPALICTYLYNEVGYTWALAGVKVEVLGGGSAAGSPPGPGSGPAGGGAAPSGAPVNTARPWVTSRARTLICHPGTWSNVTGGYSIRWLFDGKPTKVTGPQAVNRRGNRGHKASCQVTAYGPGGSTATALSAPLRLR
jgi:hypothetical protein